MSLDPYIVIDYIKSSVDIILNLKFEEIEKRLIDKTNGEDHQLLSDIDDKNKKKRQRGKNSQQINSKPLDE